MEANAASLVLKIVEEVSSDPVTPQSRLFHDLSLAGDDAWEVLEELHAALGTDFSAFPFDEYFPDETEALGATWAVKLGFKSRKKALTVQHLIEVALHGRWFEP